MTRDTMYFGSRSVAVATLSAALFVFLLAAGIRTGLGTPSVSWAEASEGALLAHAIVRIVGLVPWPWGVNLVSAVVAALGMGMLLAWLFERLIYNNWSPQMALLFAFLLATNPMVIQTAVFDHRSLSTMLACALIVLGVRRIESVGDVQANLSLGLALPLLLLDGPPLALLIVPLALFGVFADSAARKDVRAFAAMLLAAIMPTLLVLTGLLGALGVTGFLDLARHYVGSYVFRPLDPVASGQLVNVVLWTVLPFGIVTFFYLFVRDRRWQPVSALVALALPFYLMAGELAFSWNIAPTLPSVAFLAAFAAWLSVARLRPTFRLASVALLGLSSVAGWSFSGSSPEMQIALEAALSTLL